MAEINLVDLLSQRIAELAADKSSVSANCERILKLAEARAWILVPGQPHGGGPATS